MCKDKILQVTKQCDLKFAITSKFVDEIEFDVVQLDVRGIVLGTLYLYDRNGIFLENIINNIKNAIFQKIIYIARALSNKGKSLNASILVIYGYAPIQVV